VEPHPDDIQCDQIIELALEQPSCRPRELAVRFTDEKRYFVSEATVYRLLKAHDLITSPAYVVIKAADEFHTRPRAPNEMWQTDFTYFKIIGWGWFYLSTVLDDFSRYIIAWKLCTTMRGRGRHRHAGPGALAPPAATAPRCCTSPAAQRQRPQLHRG
jgi:putative transposase